MRITTPPETGRYCTGPLEVAMPERRRKKPWDEFRPAYQYGYESGLHHVGRKWNDVESDLRTGWEKFEGRRGAGSTWDSVKHAIRDAWHRVTGQHDVDADRMSEAEYDRASQGGRTR